MIAVAPATSTEFRYQRKYGEYDVPPVLVTSPEKIVRKLSSVISRGIRLEPLIDSSALNAAETT
jgi:hypothetical protein